MTETTFGQARRFTSSVLKAGGMPQDPAARTAWALCLADLWGRTSHGMMRLNYYIPRFEQGGTDARAELRLVRDFAATACYDGSNGLGHWQCWTAAEEAVRRAQTYGIGAVSVANSGHNGALGLYVLPMVERNLVGLVVSNGPAVMPPAGGHAALLSTSPIAVGVPGSPRPLIVDLATSAVARGRIAEAASRGEPIPPGWAFNSEGLPTTDAREALAGMIAPMGGAKGFALALVFEALTGGMIGPRLAGDIGDSLTLANAPLPQRTSHLLIAIDPALLDGGGSWADRMALLQSRVEAAGGRNPGASYIFGEQLHDDLVLQLSDVVVGQLDELAARLGVSSLGTNGTA